MRPLLTSFAPLVLLVLSSMGAKAAPVAATPATVLGAATAPLSASDITALLSAEQHLAMSKNVASDTYSQTSPEYARYLKQRQAIEAVGKQHLTGLIPLLLNYSDYPADLAMSSFWAPGEGGRIYSARRHWPAYNSIVVMGEEAVPELHNFIRDKRQSLQLRVTALQILNDINPQQGVDLAPWLRGDAAEQGQTGAWYLVDAIVAHESSFWGKSDFTPVTLSPTQVTALLAPEKHLDKVGSMLFAYGWPKTLLLNRTRPQNMEAEHALYLQQVEAIRTAGELRLVMLVPQLLYFVDYAKAGTSGAIGITSPDDNTKSGDRRSYPAVDAILKMGEQAIAPLQKVASDSKSDVTQRVRALYVLHYVNDSFSQTTAQAMTEEFEKAGDPATVIRIQAAINPISWAKWKARIRG